MNSARNELLRAVRNGSTYEYKQHSINKIKEMLLSNDFPPKVIDRLIGEMNVERLSKQKNTRITHYLSLSYIDEHHKRKVYQILRRNNLLEKIN
jgi:signal recognition particle GTPase